MKKYLVVGNPIEHSLSPKLQNYWLNFNNIEAIYGKLQAFDEDLRELCRSIKNGKLLLGTWQGIYLFEHRLNPQTRIVIHHFLGT